MTLAQGSSVGAWKTMPVSERGSRIGTPPIEAVPALGRIRPATMRSKVDFPQPDGPTRVTNSLAWMESDTSSSATT